MGLHLDPCQACLIPTRLHRETAPTSENELHLTPRCAPKAAAAIAHDPLLLQCGTPEPSGPQENHRTIVATTGDGGNPSLLTAIDLQPLDENKS